MTYSCGATPLYHMMQLLYSYTHNVCVVFICGQRAKIKDKLAQTQRDFRFGVCALLSKCHHLFGQDCIELQTASVSLSSVCVAKTN